MTDKKQLLEVYQEGVYLIKHKMEAERAKASISLEKQHLEEELAKDVPKEPVPEKPDVKKAGIAKYFITILLAVGCIYGFHILFLNYLEPNGILTSRYYSIADSMTLNTLQLGYAIIAIFFVFVLIIELVRSMKIEKKRKEAIASWEFVKDSVETKNRAILDEDMEKKESISNDAKLLELKLESIETTIRLTKKRYQERVLPIVGEGASITSLESNIEELKKELQEGHSSDVPEAIPEQATDVVFTTESDIPETEPEDDSTTEEIPVVSEDTSFLEQSFDEPEASATLPERSMDESTENVPEPFLELVIDEDEVIEDDSETILEPIESEDDRDGIDFDTFVLEPIPELVNKEDVKVTPSLFEDSEEDSDLEIPLMTDEPSEAVEESEPKASEGETVKAEEAEKPKDDEEVEIVEEEPSEVEETPKNSKDISEIDFEESSDKEMSKESSVEAVEVEVERPRDVIEEGEKPAIEEDVQECQEAGQETSERCLVVKECSRDVKEMQDIKEEGYEDGVSLEKLATVKRGWKMGMDIKVVSALTDLPEDKIKKLNDLFSF